MFASGFLDGITTLQNGENINCNRVILLDQLTVGWSFLAHIQCSSTVKDEWRLIEYLRPIFAHIRTLLTLVAAGRVLLSFAGSSQEASQDYYS